MRLRTSAGPDQYHAFTTRLTVGGYQALTMRVVAGCILALALPSILAGLAPSVTPWPGFRIVYTVIAVACLGLAVPWLRYRWPTRREAVLAHVGSGEFLIADVFTIADPAPLIERVRGAIAATPAGITASIGVVSTQLQPLVTRPPHDVLDELIALGSAAMADARRRGGNQSRYLLDPKLESGESAE